MKETLSILLFFMSMNCMAREVATFSEVDTLGTTLEEVNVSALKHMTSSFQGPEALSVITRAELERIDAVSIKGISDVVPNFYMPDYGSRITSTIYVRGIGARMDQPSVGLNVDNVPYINKDAYDFDVADIYKVEMLRGPQSTLYGRNTMAGVINITTLSPMRYQGIRLMMQGTTRGRFKASVSDFKLVSEKLGYSFSLAYSGAPGEFTNDYNGKKIDWEKNVSGRGKLVWHAPKGWTVQNTISAGFLKQGGYPYEYKETGRISYNDTCYYRRTNITDGLTLGKTFEGFNLSSITSCQYIDDNMTLDQDFLPTDYFTLTQKKKEFALTQDFVARGDLSDGNYRWLGGLFGFYKHLDMNAPVTFKNTGISQLIEMHRNEANPNYPIEWDSRSFPLNSDFVMPTFGVAFYHESVLNLEKFSFTAGLRLDYENVGLRYHSYCDTGYVIFHAVDGGRYFYRDVDIKIDDSGRLSRHFLNFLPKIAVSYDFGENLGNIYLKFSKGYKAGGFNTQMFSDVLQQRLMNIMGIGANYDVDDIVGYRPEQSWNYELGSHLALCEGRFDLDAAGFYIDCRDQQLTMFPDGTTTGRIMTNAGKTRSVGGELSLRYKVSGNLMLSGSYGFTDARFRKFFNGISDFKGKTLPYAPCNTLFLQCVWNTDLSQHTNLSADVDLRGVGKIYWNEDNTERQNFYCLLGAGLSLSHKKLVIRLWGKNLTDTHYNTFYFLSMKNAFFQRGKGCEVGLTIRLDV